MQTKDGWKCETPVVNSVNISFRTLKIKNMLKRPSKTNSIIRKLGGGTQMQFN